MTARMGGKAPIRAVNAGQASVSQAVWGTGNFGFGAVYEAVATLLPRSTPRLPRQRVPAMMGTGDQGFLVLAPQAGSQKNVRCRRFRS